jgi:Zn-dependent membrane protease YugP
LNEKTLFFKWPLSVFLTGYLIQIIGALFKIRHWPGADEMLTLGMITISAGVLFALIKLFILKKPVE